MVRLPEGWPTPDVRDRVGRLARDNRLLVLGLRLDGSDEAPVLNIGLRTRNDPMRTGVVRVGLEDFHRIPQGALLDAIGERIRELSRQLHDNGA